MKRAATVIALLTLGCMNEQVGPGEATPVPRIAPPAPPPGPPVKPKPPPEPVAVAPEPEPAPTEPAGLTRSKVGDLVEFSFTRVLAAKAPSMGHGHSHDPVPDDTQRRLQAMVGSSDLDKLKAAGISAPAGAPEKGTLSLVRVQPETPFTFRLEIKMGKESSQTYFAYGPDIGVHGVRFRTEPEDPRKKHKVAGTTWDCVEANGRLIDPAAASLALSGGLVSETAPAGNAVGSVSVALTRAGTSKPAAVPEGVKVKVLDTFETPIAIAMQQVQKFGFIDPEEKARQAEAAQQAVTTAAQACLSKELKPPQGALQGMIAGGKLETLTWEKQKLPKNFDKCLRLGLKKVKLPTEETFLNIQLDAAAK